MPTTSEFAREVGVAFIRAYYGASSPPSELAHMYSKDSVFNRSHKDQSGDDVNAHGSAAIKHYLSQQPQAKYQLTYVECTPTTCDSILILVEGTFCTLLRSSSFYQTFVLAPNSRADQSCYFIHNDSMRLWEDEPAEAAKPQEAYPPAPPAPPAPVEEPPQDEPAMREEDIVESIVEGVMHTPEAEAEEPIHDEAPAAAAAIEPAAVVEDVIADDELPAEDAADAAAAPVDDVAAAAVEDDAEEEADAAAADAEDDATAAAAAAAAEPAAPTETVEFDRTGMSYAQIFAAKRAAASGAASGATFKPQVVSGGAVPMSVGPKKPLDPEQRPKKRADKDFSALNLIRFNGGSKAEAGTGPSKGGKGGAKGEKGAKGSKGGEKGDKGEGKGAGRPQTFSLYVSKLPKAFSDEDCEAVFGAFGKVTGKTIRDGYAYVDFENKAAVQKALAKPITFGDATLSVEEKKSKRFDGNREAGKDGGARTQRKEQRRN